jgi:hypothetical protein
MMKKALILAAALVLGAVLLAQQPKEVACCLDGVIVYSEAVSANYGGDRSGEIFPFGGSASYADASGTYAKSWGISDAFALHIGPFGAAEAHASQDNSAETESLFAESGSETILVGNAYDGADDVSVASADGATNTYALSDGLQTATAGAGGAVIGVSGIPPFDGSIIAYYGGGSYSEANPYAGAFAQSGYELDSTPVYLGLGEGYAEGTANGVSNGVGCLGFGCTDRYPSGDAEIVVSVGTETEEEEEGGP